jgi:hypothetical protein
MSPGYDTPNQHGFERATGEGCLHCHAGRAEAVGPSLHRMRVPEPAIACERCHGPGSLHVERHGGPEAAPREVPDRTIVNPARLPRDLAEAVCQQCHLRTTAVVPARGRKLSDFRPGLPLSDIVHGYMLESPDRPMTVVGHVEQMHLSRCYQASNTLTCLTCHSPHAEPAPDDRVAHYRAACQTCHAPEKCTVSPDQRARESPANDCAHCHMPRSPTEIPHLAFTHHRIGVHGGKPPADSGPGGRLQLGAFHDLGRFSDVDRRRSLGLGYLEAANRETDPNHAADFRDRALDLLSDVRAAGLKDPAVETGLARLHFELGVGDVLPHAEAALAWPDLVGQDRCTALHLLADARANRGEYKEAVTALRELTELRRHPSDWMLLARCQNALGDAGAEYEALRAAVRINPRLWKVHQRLAEEAGRRGDRAGAEWHRARAVP